MRLKKSSIKHLNNDRTIFIACILIILIFLTSKYYKLEDSYIIIHDFLDSVVTYFKALNDSGMWFAGLDAKVNNIFNGIPRNCLPSELHIGGQLYNIFNPFYYFNSSTVT